MNICSTVNLDQIQCILISFEMAILIVVFNHPLDFFCPERALFRARKLMMLNSIILIVSWTNIDLSSQQFSNTWRTMESRCLYCKRKFFFQNRTKPKLIFLKHERYVFARGSVKAHRWPIVVLVSFWYSLSFINSYYQIS